MEIQVRKALPDDFEIVTKVGHDTFYETWREYNTPEDMAAYLKKAFDPKKRIGWHIFRRAMDMGLVLRPMGDIIYFNPPLNIEKTDLDKAVELCRKAVVTVLGE